MKTVSEISQILQGQKPYLAENYGIAEIGIFGSYVRGEQRPDSDLDILVELELYLSDLLGIKVDLAVKKNLKPRIGERILQEAIAL